MSWSVLHVPSICFATESLSALQCPRQGCLLLFSHLYHQSWFIFPFWRLTCPMFEFTKPLIFLGHPFHITLPSDKLLCISHKTLAEKYIIRKYILGHLFRSWSRAGGDIYFFCILIQASLVFSKNINRILIISFQFLYFSRCALQFFD